MLVTQTNPDDYIASLPEELRDDIRTLDKAIVKTLPKTDRVMWEGKFWGGSDQKIIGYGSKTYERSDKKKVDWFIIGLAQQKNYITVFTNAIEDKKYLTEKYKDELGKAKVGKSTITFKKLEDTNLDKLIELIKKSYSIMSA